MKSTLVKKIEIFTNIAIILVALILGAVLVKKFLFADTAATAKKDVAVGEKVSFDQVNWASNKNTLLLVLSKDCHFCSESVSFYQKINEEFGNNPSVKIAAVFPQDVPTAQEYLKTKNLVINQIYQANPPSLGVGGTPTMLLIDSNGTVVETWFGKLFPDEEQKVLNRLRSVS